MIRQSANSPITAICPGRLDVMGGIADYSGSLLLQMPIWETTKVQLTITGSNTISISTDAEERDPQFSIDFNEIRNLPYEAARALIKSRPGGKWAIYVLGCLLLLEREKGLVVNGAEITVSSEVPTGKGVSSSAAVEVATMHAIQKAFGILLDPLELSLLAQRVENFIVGAPCGLMDQLSVNLGRKDHLLPIVCQPHQLMDPITIPTSVAFFGIDSGVRHAVSGASYSEVRAAAFMAYTILAIHLGVDGAVLERARISGLWQDLPYQGFLGNIPLDEFSDRYAALIPEHISGKEFIKKYGITIDTVTVVQPDVGYRPLAAAFHPVAENNRVHRFRDLIIQLGDQENKLSIMQEMGSLMLGSHEGYSSVGLGEPVTQLIVDKVMGYGPAKGVYGARISGGGSGGTVVVLADTEKGHQTVKDIHQYMQKKTGMELYLFSGSSDGAHYLNTLH